MRLPHVFHGQKKEPHPFHVKSNWMPPVQQSIALESYLESVKTQPADIRINKPKNNVSRNEMAALNELKNNYHKSQKSGQRNYNGHHEQIKQNTGG